MLAVEEFLLAVEAPAVAGEGATLAEDAVAGNGDGEGVGGNGGGGGTNGAGLANAVGNFGVGRGGASGDFSQGVPDAALEGRAADVERQIETGVRRCDETDDVGDEARKFAVSADGLGAGKTGLQFAD